MGGEFLTAFRIPEQISRISHLIKYVCAEFLKLSGH